MIESNKLMSTILRIMVIMKYENVFKSLPTDLLTI